LFLLSAALLASMQTPPPALMVRVEGRDRQCRTLIDGASVDPNALPERLRAELQDGREVIVTGAPDTSYRCIGGVIFMLQRAGFVRFSFVADTVGSHVQ